MRRKILSFFLITVGLLFIIFTGGCDCDRELAGVVSNRLRFQETDNWCWAAVTQMLAQHESINVKQCDLANFYCGRQDCCNQDNNNSSCPKTDSCNNPGWPALEFAGLTFSESTSALSWEELAKEIFCSKKPLAYAYGVSGYVGHAVLIKGYVSVLGTNYVILNDPWPVCEGAERLITYDEYLNPSGSATHWTTWYDIAKK